MIPIETGGPWESLPFASPPPAGHAWIVLIELDLACPSHEEFSAVLNPDERDRAARFRFEEDRVRFAQARAWTRTLLGRYSGVGPGDVRLEAGLHGKLVWAGQPWHFNVSHSGELAAIALTAVGELGVDVERIRPLRDLSGVAERFFTPHERTQLEVSSSDRRESDFFECWVRKESVLKALGTGLSLAPEKIATTVEPGGTARLLAIEGEAHAASSWKLFSFVPREGYRGCLAAPSGALEVRIWRVNSASLFSGT